MTADDSSAGSASPKLFRSRIARILVLAAVAATPCLLLFLAVEWWVRAYHPEFARTALSAAISEVKLSNDYNHSLRPHHQEIFCFQNTVIERHYNSWGMAERREPEVPKPPDVWRVLVMGDSFMQAPSDAISVAGILERTLEKRRTPDGKRIEVLNGGQTSYSPLLYLTRLRHQFRLLQPDAVILSPDLTDIYDDFCRYRKYVVRDAEGKVERVLASGYGQMYHRTLERLGYYESPSQAYRWMVMVITRSLGLLRTDRIPVPPGVCRDSLEHATKNEELWSPGLRQAFNFTLDNLGLFIDEVAACGSHLFIFTYPHREQLTGQWNRAFERGIEDLCRQRGIPFHSFFDEIAAPFKLGTEIYLPGDMHFSVDGYRMLANFVAGYVAAHPQEGIGTGVPIMVSAKE